ncbi:IclR family transcriptional regulator [Neobacillus sp. LXY-4]|uniref:IclR family transcriptional regulator n=1 Tax=Neobacillus sp. LXY-4 TaxID=3379826 RepID=UPI003EE367D9
MSSVIQKSMILLEAIKPERDKEEWSATEISKKLNLPVQTVHRLLSSLSDAGFVSKSRETRKFRLSFNIIQMGFALRNSLPVYQYSRPVMERLAEKTKQCTCLTVLEGSEGVIVDWIDTKNEQNIEPFLLRNPLYIGSANKLLLAHLPSAIKEKTILSLLNNGHHFSKEHLDTELRMIKKHGFSITFGEMKEGMADIAAPIFSWEEKIVATISLFIPESLVRNPSAEDLVSLTIKAAEEISEELGWYK